MIVIAHRGIWKEDSEKNTQSALTGTFSAGFGTELDVRDSGSRLFVSHDMPENSDNCWGLAETVETWRSMHRPGYLAIDLKACGMAEKLKPIVGSDDRLFCFGVPLPELLELRELRIPFFTRFSELERQPQLYEDASGIWLDLFYSDAELLPILKKHLNCNKKVCIVSAELNGRNPDEQWDLIKRSRFCCSDNVILCTDYPQKADVYFSEK